MFIVSNGFDRVECESAELISVSDRLVTSGPLTIVERLENGVERTILAGGTVPAPASVVATPMPPIAQSAMLDEGAAIPGDKPVVYSDFGEGNQVVDVDAKARIEALHTKLQSNGVKVDAGQQLYATGTRMARMGYDNQAARKVEHDRKLDLYKAAEGLTQAIKAEGRADKVTTARELGNALDVNGKITAFGRKVTEQAIRGLAARLGSPMLGYVLGLRDRISAEAGKGDKRDVAAIKADNAKIADVLRHECLANPDVTLKLRTRANPGDVFAVVSPSFAPADAPEVLDQILKGMPSSAKASWSYDPTSTAWELRASVWTPTPVDQQAVGEPFEGYTSFQARDNGTSRFRGGGGIVLLACLNAGTYTAEGVDTSRVHRGRIMYDIGAMLKGSLAAIHTLCDAWGTNRSAKVEVPEGVKLSEAIPGFWRHLLRDQRSELAGVLPGRSEVHVKELSAAYFDQRRDKHDVVRADFAQGWTSYIQAQPTPVRREAETAIGDWLVRQGKLACDLRDNG